MGGVHTEIKKAKIAVGSKSSAARVLILEQFNPVVSAANRSSLRAS